MTLHLVSLTADIMLCDYQRKNPSKIYSSKKDIKSERHLTFRTELSGDEFIQI
jgi:hypothetical protein